MDFKEWFEEEKGRYVLKLDVVSSKKGFKFGQQSKQAEIDALKTELAKYQQEGYKLVPVDPTKEMLNAGMKECTYNTDDAIEIYKAMIGAAE